MTKALADRIYWYLNPAARKTETEKPDTSHFSSGVTQSVKKFHQTLPNFKPTPLARLDNLAEYFGIESIRVKDESYRCGLNAFKVLGASYALSSHLFQKFNLDPVNVTFEILKSNEFKNHINGLTCITATDGNHGRAVAWAARELGCRAVVYMPKGTTTARLESIRDLGADAGIIDGNYDDAVQLAADHAKTNHWLLLQDTVGPGYEEIPIRVMQGYLTMFEEAFDQLGGTLPTHVFIQCGVGSLAGSLQAYLVEKFGRHRPLLTIVEPTEAACYYQSMIAEDGKPRKVEGDLDTIMAGLACGEPNIFSWHILRNFADGFVACPDEVTALGMRMLGNPLKGDERVISGESGAVTLGLLAQIMEQPELSPLKQALNIQSNARVLLFSTEGDTDPAMYRRIVWG
jgi:diaminopropionate ammonia-lyase